MDIKPTLVEVKDIVILDSNNYDSNVLIQVIGYENATSPLLIPYEKLKEFAGRVNGLTVGPLQPTEIPVIDLNEATQAGEE